MASLKLGSAPSNRFQRKGQAWFYTTGLLSDVTIKVEGVLFHLHKFPLVSRSGRLTEALACFDSNGATCKVELNDIPGGSDAFELAAKFCYGVKLELTSGNVVVLRCAAAYLEMTEAFGEGNLIVRTEAFLNQVVFRSWKESVHALSSCEAVSVHAESLGIVKRCVDSLAAMSCTDPSLFGWPLSMQSPGGSLMWNGISTGARPRSFRSDWWYADTALLSLPLYEKLIAEMKVRGIRADIIAGALRLYAKRRLPVLNKRRHMQDASNRTLSLASMLSETDQILVLETVERLLPMQKGVVSTHFLSGLLRSAIILNAGHKCKNNLEKRIGSQLEHARLKDLLFPNLSDNLETLYDTDCFRKILQHFLSSDQSAIVAPSSSSPYSVEEGQTRSSTTLTPIVAVARLTDCYLAEIASDVNLKPYKFGELAEALPEHSRISDDDLYQAVDIYLKAHPWLTQVEREKVCRVMNCRKLSVEACTHAAQNERLPLRVIVQVLFFEQLQLRMFIASSFMASDTLHPLGHHSLANNSNGVAIPLYENQALKEDMENMKQRVQALGKECDGIRRDARKLKSPLRLLPKMLGYKFASHICTMKNDVASSDKSFRPSQSRHRRKSPLV